jgi:hypothetical protein
MSESTAFTIGSTVACSDGECGELRLVVVDPVARALAHLVVDPHHRVGAGRLVPIELVESSAAQEIRLRCTRAQFDELPDAEETRFLPGTSGGYGYGPGQVVSLPYFGLGGMGLGMGGVGALGIGGAGLGGMDAGPHAVISDRVPVGEVAVRRGDSVAATDGDIGRVAGLVIDPSDHHVTHVLLDEGHLWGHKRVAIPIGAVAGVSETEGVSVKLTKDQVRDLPAIEVEPPA